MVAGATGNVIAQNNNQTDLLDLVPTDLSNPDHSRRSGFTFGQRNHNRWEICDYVVIRWLRPQFKFPAKIEMAFSHIVSWASFGSWSSLAWNPWDLCLLVYQIQTKDFNMNEYFEKESTKVGFFGKKPASWCSK